MGFTDRAIANTSSSYRHEQGGQLSSGLAAVEGDGGLFALPPTITQPVTFATRICSRVTIWRRDVDWPKGHAAV